jgi:hypothetical protein
MGWAFLLGKRGKGFSIYRRKIQVRIASERVDKMILKFAYAVYLFVLLKSPVPRDRPPVNLPGRVVVSSHFMSAELCRDCL